MMKNLFLLAALTFGLTLAARALAADPSGGPTKEQLKALADGFQKATGKELKFGSSTDAATKAIRQTVILPSELSDADVAALPVVPFPFDLEIIDFPPNATAPLTDEGVAKLAGQTNLHKLVVRQAKKVAGSGFAKLGELKSLTAVDLTGANLTDATVTAKGVEAIASLPHLTSVSLADTLIDDTAVAGLNKAVSLTTLSLGGTGVTTKGLKALDKLTGLTTLGLCGADRLTDDGIGVITHFPALRSLDLSLTGVTDKGLPELTGLKELTTLNLAGTEVSGDSLATLVKLKTLKKVELNSVKWPKAAVKNLQDALQGCAVTVH